MLMPSIFGENLFDEDGRNYIVYGNDVPGFKKDEVKVALKDGYLTVSAAKGLDEEEDDKKTGRYIRRERYAGACSGTSTIFSTMAR